jgi:hypothetical protein
MAMTGQELTRLALERLADGSPSELVRVLRLSELTDSQHIVKNIERWRDGKHEPSYGFAIRALEQLGMLRDAPGEIGVAAHSLGSEERSPAVLLAELEEAIAAMLLTQQTLVADLGETHTRLQQLEAAQPDASVRRTRKTGTG